ncbi:MAG: hypothetical protein A2583_00930 [Bdellovibrionales bacterium RIFOXYD1_FULL_53_11]|nr:MAG: hypothetical protein A2583_00930 [Bdellovibrionales bacterium RIFOXYD1_FULL_53_11]
MRLLGLDQGTTGIKAVEVDSAFGRYEIHDYHEIKTPPGTTHEEMCQAVKRFIDGLQKKPDRISVCVRTGHATFRNLQIPSRDKKTIQASVGFELDDDLPFPLEQAAYDHSILSQTGPSTHLHVSATLIKKIEEYIASWSALGIDPDIITTEAWACRTLVNRIMGPAAQEQPIVLVMTGHEHTMLYVHWRGVPVAAREIAWGGRELTSAISRRYGLPLDQAEKMKIEHGFVIPQSAREAATPEQVDFSSTLLAPVQELCGEMRKILLICKNATGASPSAIYLGGGSSLLHGLAGTLEEEMHIPVHALGALSAITPSGITYSEHSNATFALAAALALSMVKSPDRSTLINLRKGSLAKQGRSQELSLATLRRPLLASGAVTASIVVSMIVQLAAYKTKLTDMDVKLERDIRTFFGQVSQSAMRTYIASTSTLRKSIDKELTKQREMSRFLTPNPRSPLSFLANLSSSVPDDIVVDLTQFQIGSSAAGAYSKDAPANASLTFLVTNPQLAEKLAVVLGDKIGDIQRSKTEEAQAPDGSGKRWKVTFSGKPKEESYGN